MNLDNPEEFKKLDPDGIEEALVKFPEQLGESWDQAYSSGISRIEGFDKVIISGMGGSALAGRIIASVFESELSFPIFVHTDYGLPLFADDKTLVVINSYSGNTEESLSGLARAREIGAKTLGVATGGKLGEEIKSGKLDGAILAPTTNPSGFPKSALGVSFGGLLGAFSKAGIVNLSAEDFEKTVSELSEIRKDWTSDSETTENLVKRMAKVLFDKIPVLIAGRPLLGAVHASRNVLNEIGRTFSLYLDMPEMDHHTVEATGYPKSANEILNYVFIESDLYSERVKLRFDITLKLFDDQKLQTGWVKLRGKNALTQSLELAHLFGWISFYLSMLNGQDPGPEPWILKLKDSLAQPLH